MTNNLFWPDEPFVKVTGHNYRACINQVIDDFGGMVKTYNHLEDWGSFGSFYILYGSLVPKEKAPKDIDGLFLAKKDQLETIDAVLKNSGWVHQEHEYDSAPVVSYRKAHLNAIVTENSDYFYRMVLACDICRMLKVTDKTLRMDVHARCRDFVGL